MKRFVVSRKSNISFQVAVLLTTLAASIHAQIGGGAGGVTIDADGLVKAIERPAQRPKPPANDEKWAAPSDQRVISLRGLDAQIREALKSSPDLLDEIRLLAGLHAIDVITLDPASEDILIAGPAEDWKLSADGREIGQTSGRAMIHLEDLATALRAVLRGNGRITCSIDPTREGLAAMQRVPGVVVHNKKDSESQEAAMREALGLQTVTTTGVPAGSRFARTMVEADYMMKRYAIGDVRGAGVSNHLDALIAKNRAGDFKPGLVRWWFVSDYAPFDTDATGQSFAIRGPRVKLLNEAVMLRADGERGGTGHASEQDQFSKEFSGAFPKFESKVPVFSDLRNLYDLVLVAGLVKKLGAASWLQDSILLDEQSLPTPEQTAPKHAESVASSSLHSGKLETGGRGQVLTVAVGGVAMDAGSIDGLLGDQPAFVAKSPHDNDAVPGGSPDTDTKPGSSLDEAKVGSIKRPDRHWWQDPKGEN